MQADEQTHRKERGEEMKRKTGMSKCTVCFCEFEPFADSHRCPECLLEAYKRLEEAIVAYREGHKAVMEVIG
jgi:hypothetical protein